ncbi:eukaryotic translation initiation factor 3 subunit L [Pelomyxa schiedti]|nr:eukaryotic translation initiation factor 3 subunit L [Pelomyxa schiedti]
MTAMDPSAFTRMDNVNFDDDALDFAADVPDDEDTLAGPGEPGASASSSGATGGVSAESVSTSTVPDKVRDFLGKLQRAIDARDAAATMALYDERYTHYTEKFFWTRPWPSFDSVSVFLPRPDDDLFRTLYKELYFRHIYGKVQRNAKKQPTIDQRLDSWTNFVDLFNIILVKDISSVQLPAQWVWDILDEFIYQVQAFAQYRANLTGKSEEEINALKKDPQVWSICTAMKILHSLVKKNQELLGKSVQTTPESSETRSIYSYFSEFATVQLCRLHCILGDYHRSLLSLEPLHLQQKFPQSQVLSCYTTQQYYIGFSCLMLRRYVDAVKSFGAILRYTARAKPYHPKSYQQDSISKKNEQLYALLALSITLCPLRVDNHVHQTLNDKYGDKLTKLQHGDETCFEEVFTFSCPKFITAAQPDYDARGTNLFAEPLKLQRGLFMNEVRHQLKILQIRSYLRLYTSISLTKLASYLQMNASELNTELLNYKHKTTQLICSGTSFPLHEGKWGLSSSEPDFYIENDIVYVTAPTKPEAAASADADASASAPGSAPLKGPSEYFLRHITRLNNITPMPIVPQSQPADTQTPPAASSTTTPKPTTATAAAANKAGAPRSTGTATYSSAPTPTSSTAPKVSALGAPPKKNPWNIPKKS